jgi:hypothetical protein
MSTSAQSARGVGAVVLPSRIDPVARRGAAVAALVALAGATPGGWEAAAEALSEAYLAVAVFVAGTLFLVYAAERALGTDLGHWLARYRRWQVPAGALLGAFPGCGGAIVAVTQFTRGSLGFGAVVATLTATMGDAMFLLLAREPATALGVLGLGMAAGIVSGYAVDAIHGPSFLRPRQQRASLATSVEPRPWLPASSTWPERLWMAIAVPGIPIGVLAAFRIEMEPVRLGSISLDPSLLLGAVGAALALGMWVRNGGEASNRPCRDGMCSTQPRAVVRDVIADTNFITSWVVLAFVLFELAVASSGIDLGAMLAVWGPLVPAIAIAIGFVPGCGPQIVVTSLYLAGSIPLSAQLGNAIANDGDALFPAIAVAPRAALMASIYSAIPALVVGYGWYWVME